MALEQVQNLPQQYVTDLGVDYGKQLAGLTSIPLDTAKLAPQVAAQDPLQQQAYSLAGSGVGAYQPYLTQQAAYSGPQAYQSFMSPYQTDVIDATLSEFDKQTAAGLSGIGQRATMSGNLGGGREGVMRSQYQSQQDANRALLQARLLQQGFGQAQSAAQTAFNQQGVLGQNIQNLQTADINQLGRLGGLQQAQEQAQLDAIREANRLEAYEPYERLGTYGSGVASLFSGNAPFGSQSTVTPNPTPLQTALGTASVLSGIFGGGQPNQAQTMAQSAVLPYTRDFYKTQYPR
jgi:hypothetical protein|tara:strand:+ start:1044 stop:1916 length:873 start_codon:yes stop_codon:yes gene_type:complete